MFLDIVRKVSYCAFSGSFQGKNVSCRQSNAFLVYQMFDRREQLLEFIRVSSNNGFEFTNRNRFEYLCGLVRDTRIDSRIGEKTFDDFHLAPTNRFPYQYFPYTKGVHTGVLKQELYDVGVPVETRHL